MASLPVTISQQAVERKDQQQHRSQHADVADMRNAETKMWQTELLFAWYSSDGLVIRVSKTINYNSLLK